MRLWMIAAIVAGTAGAAWGQDNPEPRSKGPAAERLFKVLDADGDGKIDREELERKLPMILDRMGGDGERPREREMPERPRAKKPDRDERRDGPPGGPLIDGPKARPGRGDGPPPAVMGRIEQLVERMVRDILERHKREIAERIERLVEGKVREALDREGPKGPGGPERELRPAPRRGDGERPAGDRPAFRGRWEKFGPPDGPRFRPPMWERWRDRDWDGPRRPMRGQGGWDDRERP